jgi:hypothetical protein
MAFKVKHTNSSGQAESQTVAASDVISLMSKIGRLGGSEIMVISARGERWNVTEAATHLMAAGHV